MFVAIPYNGKYERICQNVSEVCQITLFMRSDRSSWNIPRAFPETPKELEQKQRDIKVAEFGCTVYMHRVPEN